MLFTSLVLGVGFGIFMGGYMVNIFWFGLLSSFAVVVAFVADITLAPALMMLVTPKRTKLVGSASGTTLVGSAAAGGR